MRKRICVISDIHCGSIFGMLPKGFITSEGVEKLQNVAQRFLWDCWLDYCQSVKEFKPDIIIANGDLIDGMQQLQKGTELSLPLIFDQRRAATQTLKVLKKAAPNARWFFVQGTEYHVGKAAEHEEEIAKDIGGEKYDSIPGSTGVLVKEVLWLKIDGVIIESSHHIGGGGGFYRLTGLDREMQWSAMAAKDESKGIPKADLLIRSHVHNYSVGEHASKQGVVSPCWQLQTRHARKRSVYRLMPDIGGLFIEVDSERKRRGRNPCLVDRELYPLPPVRPVVISE